MRNAECLRFCVRKWSWVIDKYFGSKGEVEQHFRAFKNYRNPLKHGRDLNEIDKRNGEASVLWLENILK